MIHEISYKTVEGSIQLGIRFDEIDGIIKTYYGIRDLVLIGGVFHNEIFDMIKYLISKKVVSQIVSIIILQDSELIHIILYR